MCAGSLTCFPRACVDDVAFGHHNPGFMWQRRCELNATGNASTSRGVQPLSPHHLQHGPFTYAKGPLYVLSHGLAKRLSSDPPTVQRAAEALRSADARASGGGAGVGTWAESSVWEDVVSVAAKAQQPAAHAHDRHYTARAYRPYRTSAACTRRAHCIPAPDAIPCVLLHTCTCVMAVDWLRPQSPRAFAVVSAAAAQCATIRSL